MNADDTSRPALARTVSPGGLVLVGDDARGLARLDRWVGDASARVFFFADGQFEIVDRETVIAAPVGAGAPLHVDTPRAEDD